MRAELEALAESEAAGTTSPEAAAARLASWLEDEDLAPLRDGVAGDLGFACEELWGEVELYFGELGG